MVEWIPVIVRIFGAIVFMLVLSGIIRLVSFVVSKIKAGKNGNNSMPEG